jgi:hypothetical protein
VEKWRRNGRDCPVFSKSGSLCQISSSAERTPKPISTSAHQHNLGEKLKSGEVEKKWQRLSGFFQIGQSLSIFVNICLGEKWKSGEVLTETINVFSKSGSLCQISSSAERTPKPFG